MTSPGNAAAPGANTEGDKNDPAGELIDSEDTSRSGVIERCAKCTDLGTRMLGTTVLCNEHADELLDPIRARVILPEGFDGVGRDVAPAS